VVPTLRVPDYPNKKKERERESIGARAGGHGEQRTASLRSVASVLLSAFEKRNAIFFFVFFNFLSWACIERDLPPH
jgi:hypothetical protein